ncbi:ABC transporter permease [Clostridiales bacterium COT073_COT-073]|nr:ABC transporter permease [Clostridiales bacterium COT073_COT-073]
MDDRSRLKKLNRWMPVIAVLLGFLLGALIMVVTGENPLILFKSMVRAVLGLNLDNIGTDKPVFSVRTLATLLVYAMPIIMTGLSVAFAFRTGLFNIGAEGQVLVGSMAAAVIGVLFDGPALLLLPATVLGGALAGAIWGFIAGYLKAKYNVHEVVVTIMLNYTARYLSNYVLKALPGSSSNETVRLHENALLQSKFLSEMTGRSQFHWGFIIVIISIIIFSYIINKTTFGYELKAVGYNPHAAEYAGMKVKRNAALSMAIAGAFSGLAGVLLVSGLFGKGRVLVSFENYGFDGIAVALIGGNTAIGSLFSGLLLAALKVAQPFMTAQKVPDAIAVIISASIIVFVAMKTGLVEMIMKVRRAK